MNVIHRLANVLGALAGLLTAWSVGWALFVAGYAVLSLGDHPAHSRKEYEQAIIEAHNDREWDARNELAQMMLKQDGRTRYRVSELRLTFVLVEGGNEAMIKAKLKWLDGELSGIEKELVEFMYNDPDVVPKTRWGAHDTLQGVMNDGVLFFGPGCLGILIYIINYIAVGRPRVMFWKA